MTESSVKRRVPWPAVIGLAVVAVLAAASLAWIQFGRSDGAKTSLSNDEIHATDAARLFVVNTFTYTQADFDADFQRALAGTTGDLTTQVQASKANLQSALTTNKVDWKGQVTSAGVEQVTGSTIVVMVVANQYVIGSDGKSDLKAHPRVEVAMKKVNGKWLASGLTSVGLV
jgi:hypothetical protein